MIDRIHERAVFRRFGGNAVRSRSGPLTLIRADLENHRSVAAAYAIPRSVGAAVVRNRLRRQLRVVMSGLQRDGALPPGYYLVAVRPGATGSSTDELDRWSSAAATDLRAKLDARRSVGSGSEPDPPPNTSAQIVNIDRLRHNDRSKR